LVRIKSLFGRSWALLRPSKGRLAGLVAPYWTALGPSRGPLGASRRPLGCSQYLLGCLRATNKKTKMPMQNAQIWPRRAPPRDPKALSALEPLSDPLKCCQAVQRSSCTRLGAYWAPSNHSRSRKSLEKDTLHVEIRGCAPCLAERFPQAPLGCSSISFTMQLQSCWKHAFRHPPLLPLPRRALPSKPP
jgi:hypothetical protein